MYELRINGGFVADYSDKKTAITDYNRMAKNNKNSLVEVIFIGETVFLSNAEDLAWENEGNNDVNLRSLCSDGFAKSFFESNK